MNLRTGWKLFLVAVWAVVGTGCGPKEKVVKVGVALPLTGDIAGLGQGLKRAITLGLEQANQEGMFQGYRVELKIFDDRSDPKEAVDVANRIVADKNVVAMIGHFNSGCSIPASQVYAKHRVAMVNPCSSNPKLTLQQLDPSWKYPLSVFRVYSTDDVQGTFAGDYVRKTMKLSRVAIIHDKTAYGQGVAEEFKKRFEANGGRILAFDGISVADKDFTAVLTRIHELQPQVVYFGGDYAGGGLVLRQLRGVGEKAPIILTEANLDPELLRVAGPAAEGAYITFLGTPPDLLPTAKGFVAAYKERYPDDEMKAYDHFGYEAMRIIADTLKKVGPDRDKILAELPKTDYKGVLGDTRFDNKGDTFNKTVTLFQVKNGKFEPLK